MNRLFTYEEPVEDEIGAYGPAYESPYPSYEEEENSPNLVERLQGTEAIFKDLERIEEIKPDPHTEMNQVLSTGFGMILNPATTSAAVINRNTDREEYTRLHHRTLESLRERGYSNHLMYEKDVAAFKLLFLQDALKKANEMLDSNEAKVNAEIQQYSKQERVVAFLKVLQSVRPLFGVKQQAQFEYDKASGTAGTAPYKAYLERKAFNRPGVLMPEYGEIAKDLGKLQVAHREGQPNTVRPSTPDKHDFKNVVNQLDDQIRKALVLEFGETFPILADQRFKLENMSSYATEGQLKTHLDDVLGSALSSIAETRTHLKEKPNLVWEFLPVIAATSKSLKIKKDTIFDLIVASQVEEVQYMIEQRDRMLASLGIVLGLASIFSGGTLAWLYLGLGVGVSALEAYYSYQDYAHHHHAAKGNINKADALTDKDPSIGWFVLSLFGLGLDAVSVLKLTMRLTKTVAKINVVGDGSSMDSLIQDVVNASKEEILNIPAGYTAETFAYKIGDWTEKMAKLNHYANGVPLITKLDIIQKLDGVTVKSTQVARLIEDGIIKINILDDVGFRKYAHPNVNVMAYQSGNTVYLRKNRGYYIFSDSVHEGVHVIDSLDKDLVKKLGNYTDNALEWEKRAFFAEREFQVASRSGVEFETVEEMIAHIKMEYDDNI